MRIEFEDGRSLTADKVLVALGRQANIEDLNLVAAGIELTESCAMLPAP